jgi:hypothetical protein
MGSVLQQRKMVLLLYERGSFLDAELWGDFLPGTTFFYRVQGAGE